MTEIKINTYKDSLLSEQAKTLLKDYYMLPHEKSPQECFARASLAYCYGDFELAQRIYDYVSNGWFMFSSPILSNAPIYGQNPKALPISCYLNFVEDTLQGIIGHSVETRWLSVKGGGVGGHWSKVRSHSSKSPGIMPFLHTIDSDMVAYTQASTRKGSYAAYLDVNNSDIMEFINMRTPTGGDINRKNLNLHHGINITDDFMQAVKNDDNFDLICPHSKEVRETVSARKLWQKILETRYRTGEPYLHFIDTANRAIPQKLKDKDLRINGSNLCVAPETLILTKEYGYKEISTLENQDVHVWNGNEWSLTTVRKTSENSELIKVTFDDDSYIDCTKEHKFYIVTGDNNKGVKKVDAIDLNEGDKLIRFNLPDDVNPRTEFDKEAYSKGFYSGDGNRGYNRSSVYRPKESVIPYLVGRVNSDYDKHERRMWSHPYWDKDYVPNGMNINEAISWLEGYFDADGCVTSNISCQNIQVASIDHHQIQMIKLLLQTLGISSNVSFRRKAEQRMMPKNDGTGDSKLYNCKDVYLLVVNGNGLKKLISYGYSPKRLSLNFNLKYDTPIFTRFKKIKSIEITDRFDKTYCFTESKRNMGMFNGVLLGNCIEIHLPTNQERTAVCCLSSLNIELYDEWKDSNIVEDLITFLDNVLQYFIDHAPDELSKAKYSASMERSLGLGAMGFHAYLQKKMIPFTHKDAKEVNNDIFKNIKLKAVKQSLKLGKERGEAPDMVGTGLRNAFLLAIAPNANSSMIMGTTPSIEPMNANAFTHRSRVGSHLIKNKILENLLDKYEQNTDEVWKTIILDGGSVRTLDFLTEHEKDVFKTFKEINPMDIILLASDRQKYLCQGQSINLYFPPKCDKKILNEVHYKAWEKGCKGLYYLRTESSNKVDKLSEKVERNSLKDYKEATDNECKACEG